MTKTTQAVAGKVKAELVAANVVSLVPSRMLEGNKHFSSVQIAKDENTSKRMIIWKAVANEVPSILAGQEVPFDVKAILGAAGHTSTYMADSLRGKLRGYLEEKLECGIVLTTVKIEGKKVKKFTIRKAVKLLK